VIFLSAKNAKAREDEKRKIAWIQATPNIQPFQDFLRVPSRPSRITDI